MRVLVTGGTGFVGAPVLKTLLEQGHEVRALVRDPSRLHVAGAEAFQGDVLEPATLASAAQGCQGCVHLVGILRENPDKGITFDRLHFKATQNILAACLQAEVRRFVHISANGAERAIPMPYFASKARAEVAVQASSMETVILRPSLIYGGSKEREKDSFIGNLESVFSWAPAIPYFLGQPARLAPISAHEVALAVGAALVRPDVVNKAYPLCGEEEFTWKELLTLVRDLGSHKALIFPMPFSWAKGMSRFIGLTPDMLELLKVGNAQPKGESHFHAPLGVIPESFKQWLLERGGGQQALEAGPEEPLERARPTRELHIPRIEDYPPGELPGSGENLP